MSDITKRAIEILAQLVGFESLSGRPTHGIVGYIHNYLNECGVDCSLSYDEAGERANVFATIGPEIDGGVILNGHTDVVPVDGQTWTSDPFTLTQRGSRLYGRGAVDMKGFLACVLASVPRFQSADLKRPIHIAFTYDEETGGFGVPVLLNSLTGVPFRPSIAIVGEPTDMKIITGHKGGHEMRTEITGLAVHSCDPRQGVNAISAAMKLISKIENMNEDRATNPQINSPFDPPYPTFNVGTIEGGAARNATAGWCNFNWEYRTMPGEVGADVIAEIEAFAANEILPQMKAVSEEANIRIITETAVPPLDNRHAALATELVSSVTGINDTGVVSFGTDAGYFSDAEISTVVFGPGSINRAHKADEYIEIDELNQGLDFLDKLSQKLSQ